MAVITVSRQLGSLGDEIAKGVSERLGCEFVEKAKISEALRRQGFEPPEIDRFDEVKPSVWQSLSQQRNRFLYSLRAAIYDFAAGQNAVILGRGGQVLLQELPGALHVRVTAPLKRRVARLVDRHGYENKQAERLIRKSDRESAGFIGGFFDADWDDVDLYDLVLGTRTMSVETGVGLIVDAVGAPEFRRRSETMAARLKDLALQQKVESVLLSFPRVEVSSIDVRDGVVRLVGLTSSPEIVKNCEKAIGAIEGLRGSDIKIDAIEITLG